MDVWIDVGLVVAVEDRPAPLPPIVEGPRVVGIDASGAAGGEIRVSFEPAMDPETLDPEAIPLVGPEGIVATGVYATDRGRTAVVHPLAPLPPGRYQLAVDAARVHTRRGEAPGRGAVRIFEVE